MKELIDIIDRRFYNSSVPDIDQIILDHLSHGNGTVILFGASIGGKEVLEKFKKRNIKVDFFSDNNEDLWGKKFEGIRVISPPELKSIENPIIIISSSFQSSIYTQLKTLDFDKVLHFPLVDIISKKHFSEDIIFDAKEEIIDALASFEDEESKRVLSGLIKYRLTKDLSHIEKVRSNNIYFPDFLKLKENEVFVDIGAFTGDTIHLFNEMNLTNQKSKIVAFEPDPVNFSILKSKFDLDKRVTLSNLCVYDKVTELTFSNESDSSTSHISSDEPDGFKVKTTTLDKFFNNDLQPTFIKMDVEGSERSILNGGIEVITNNNPILAISVYHLPTDLWEILAMIKKMDVSYKYYLRHHSYNICDTVLYCLPINNKN